MPKHSDDCSHMQTNAAYAHLQRGRFRRGRGMLNDASVNHGQASDFIFLRWLVYVTHVNVFGSLWFQPPINNGGH